MQIAELGENEMDEGALRLAASQLAADRASELAAAGLLKGLQGEAELAMAAEDAELAADLAAEGVAGVAAGSAELGAAAAMEDVADALDEG